MNLPRAWGRGRAVGDSLSEEAMSGASKEAIEIESTTQVWAKRLGDLQAGSFCTAPARGPCWKLGRELYGYWPYSQRLEVVVGPTLVVEDGATSGRHGRTRAG